MNAMMERMGMTAPTTGMPGMGMGMAPGMMGSSSTMPTGMNMMMVPRGTIKMEKCEGGMKITCSCDDKMASSTMQNLCTMLTGGMVSCCTMMNGMMTSCCNLMMGMSKCETTDDGCCFTCTSGDKDCAAMIQACCDCCSTMMAAGCTCCLMMNGTPVCCGC